MSKEPRAAFGDFGSDPTPPTVFNVIIHDTAAPDRLRGTHKFVRTVTVPNVRTKREAMDAAEKAYNGWEAVEARLAHDIPTVMVIVDGEWKRM